jgi:hypothetical protein
MGVRTVQSQSPNRAVISELYRSLVLLRADNGLLGTVGSWGDSLSDEDVLAGLKTWNEATLREAKGSIEHYENSSRRLVYSQGEDRENSSKERLAS